MELAFTTRSLRDMCAKKDQLVSEFGDPLATLIMNRLSDIRAADRLAEIPSIFYSQRDSSSKDEYMFHLDKTYFLKATIGNLEIPRTSSNAIDLSKVTRLKIESIESVK